VKRNVLLAESGGSKTDWVYLSTNGQKTESSSFSMHPNQWEEMDWDQLSIIWNKMEVDSTNTDVHFFGAGCNSIEKAKTLKEKFKVFDFNTVQVSGDLLAAGFATLGNENGYVAILGSGSVLIDYREQKVQKFFGGLGRKLGDEGAGYYFGKLVLTDFIDGKLTSLNSSLLKSVLTITQLREIENRLLSDELCLQMSVLLSDRLFEFQDYHKRNLQLFFDKYVNENVPSNSRIHFVGSYGYFHEELVKEICLKSEFVPGCFLARPIELLTSYFIKQSNK
jgi:hypothetical protein